MQNLPLQQHSDRDSFEALRPLLEEMVSTLKSQYIKSDIGHASATLEVGLGQEKTEWTIAPTHGAPGFSIHKTQYFFREKDTDTFEFPSEPETMEYLVKEIVEQIVYCGYWEAGKELKTG